MTSFIRVILLSLALGSPFASAFDGWPGDQSITRKTPDAVAKADENSPIHAVFQVSDSNPDSWKVTLGSAIETIKALGDKKARIEIVAFGPGVDGLKRGSEWTAAVKQALDAGVVIMVSESAMAVLHYKHDDMLPNLKYVPVGAVEILKKQKMGYLYLRP